MGKTSNGGEAGGSTEPLGGDHFDAHKDSEANKAMAEKLMAPAKMFKGPDGKEYPISYANVMSSQVRNTVTKTLKLLDPAAFAEYRKMKYAGGENPTLEQRHKAYQFAFKRFLELTYTVAGF